MIYLITNRASEYNEEELNANNIKFAKGKDFLSWLNTYRDETQFDTETNMVRNIYDFERPRKGRNDWGDPILNENGEKTPVQRKVVLAQVGDKKGNVQWLFDMKGLKGKKLEALFAYLKSDNVKIMHNAAFDYTVILFNYGIKMTNIRDTFLMSKISKSGLKSGIDLEVGYHSLAGCVERYLGVDLSKAAQTSFDENSVFNAEQLLYAATDVAVLGKVHDALQKEIDLWGLENTVRLECAVVRAYGNAMVENFYLDIPKWQKNIEAQNQKLEDIISNIHSVMKRDFEEECYDLGFIQKDDEYLFNWRSSSKIKSLLKLAYPDFPDDATTVKGRKDYLDILHQRVEDGEDIQVDILEYLVNKNYEKVEELFIKRYRTKLEEIGMYIPKGTVNLNLNSPAQTLDLFKLIKPEIENTNKETISKINHDLAFEFKNFQKAAKLATSYGENFIDACGPDNMLRINGLIQILDTGRTSLKLYQLLPSDSNTYRSCFYPEKGWKVIGVDYNSQEAVVAATVCKEEKLLEAIKNGYDFHSVCASLMFPKQWSALGGDPNPKDKPKDKDLLKLRNNSKVTSFGLMYGKSSVGLAESLDLLVGTEELIEFYPKETEEFMRSNEVDYNRFVNERYKGRFSRTSMKMFLKHEHSMGRYLPEIITGGDLVDRFYNAFPNIHKTLVNGAEDAAKKAYIRTPDVFSRVRFFNNPESTKEQKAIIRRAMNFPIQSTSANITKYALVLINKYIEENDLEDKVKFFLPIHDEIICVAKEEFAEEWLKIQTEIMEDAAAKVLGHNYQKAEGQVSDTWVK